MRVIYQNEVAECGYACLAMVLTHLGRATDVQELSAVRPLSANGVTLYDLYEVATEFGLAVQAWKFGPDDIREIRRGSILHFGGAHFVVFERLRRGYAYIIDPSTGRRRIPVDLFVAHASGFLLECHRTPELPRIRARSKVPAALARVRTLNPQLRGQIARVLFVAIGAQFAVLAMPYFGSLVLDYVVSADNLDLLDVLVFAFAGIFAAGALGNYVQTRLTNLVAGAVQVNVTEGLVGHLLRRPAPFFEKRNVGDLFAKVRAHDEINSFASRTVIALVLDGAVAALALGLMLIQSPRLTAIAMLVFLGYIAVAIAVYAAIRDARMRELEESADCDDMLIETIRAASLIKLSSGETRRTALFAGRFRTFVGAQLERQRLEAVRDATLKLIQYVDLLAVTWFAARLMLGGKISVGVFYSFMIYKGLVSERLANVINNVFAWLMLNVPATRAADIADGDTERYTASADAHRAPELRAFGALVVSGVSFRYGLSDRWVLKDASLAIRRGDKIAIVGASGAGKSTLFKLISALEPLQQGQVTLNGIAWPNLAVDEVRRHLAQMRQGDIILHGSIADNVSLFSADPDEQRIYRALEDVGLLPDVMSLPMRARTIVSDTIANISAGQRQRLLLARALYQQREVLLLDEPTSNLDPASVDAIATLLQRLDRTIVIITHDTGLAARFARRYRLCDGALVPETAAAAQGGSAPPSPSPEAA